MYQPLGQLLDWEIRKHVLIGASQLITLATFLRHYLNQILGTECLFEIRVDNIHVFGIKSKDRDAYGIGTEEVGGFERRIVSNDVRRNSENVCL